MASRDILVLNTTASRAETQQGSDTVAIRGDSGVALSVENSSGTSILSVNTVSSSVDIAGKITATADVSSSLGSSGSFGRLEATTLVGSAFNLSNTAIPGTISSSGQIANQISGSFRRGFEFTGTIGDTIPDQENRITASFGRIVATSLSGSAANLTNTVLDNTLSSSAQIASNISGSFNKGFEYTGKISGSATSTGSFNKLDVITLTGDVSQMSNLVKTGLVSGSAQLASDISGSFQKGFEFDGHISGSAVTTASFANVFARKAVGDISSMYNLYPKDVVTEVGDIATQISRSFAHTGFEYTGTIQALKSWAFGTPMNKGHMEHGAVGNKASALVFGGFLAPGSITTPNSTEEWNGSNWSYGGDMITARTCMAAFGISTEAAIAAGGTSQDSEEYNGSAWSEINDTIVNTRGGGGTGTTEAGIVAGRTTSPYQQTETFNGTNWSEVNDLITGNVAGFGRMIGTQNAGYYKHPGAGGNTSLCTQEWNGTNWSEVNNSNTQRTGGGGFAGSVNDAWLAGGHPNTPATTEEWDGTAWSNLPASSNLNCIRRYSFGIGLPSAGMQTGGQKNPNVSPYADNTIEEFTHGTTTGSFHNIFATTIHGDISNMTNIIPSGVVSGSAQVASNISGSFNKGFEFVGTIKKGFGTWAAGANMINAYRCSTTGCFAGAGTKNAFMIVDQYENTELWDGSSWTEANNRNDEDILSGGGAGTSNSAIIFGGLGLPSYTVHAGSEEWNGTNWSDSTDLITAITNGGSAGQLSSENALYFGGTTYPTKVGNTQEWNGSAWSELNDLINSARSNVTGLGTTEAALAVGTNNPIQGNTEQWNGTNWSEVASNALGGPSGIGAPYNNFHDNGAGGGTVNDAHVYGGSTHGGPYRQSNSLIFDGTSWAQDAALNTVRRYVSGNGTTSGNVIAVGGSDNAQATELFTTAVANTGSFGRVEVTSISGDGSNLTNSALAGTISSSGQIASSISGSFNQGFTFTGTIQNEPYTFTEVAALNVGRQALGASGIKTAGLVFGGYAHPTQVNSTETFNGSSWSEVNNLNTAGRGIGGSGTSTATVAFGGHPTRNQYTEEWNGTNWSEVNDMIRSDFACQAADIGISSEAAIAAGSCTTGAFGSSNVLCNEEWNGTNWATANALIHNASQTGGGAGSANAGITAGGFISPGYPGAHRCTQLWNGTNWSEAAAALPPSNHRGILYGWGGSQNDAIITSGCSYQGGLFDTSYCYNGISWSAGSAIGTLTGATNAGVYRHKGAGTTVDNSFFAGGIGGGGGNNSSIAAAFCTDNGVATGSFSHIDAIRITGSVDGMTNIPEPVGTISGSAQIASQISGSFKKGFEFTGEIESKGVWSAGGDFPGNLKHTYHGGVWGTQNSALLGGGIGIYQSAVCDTFSYNGTSWSDTGANMINAKGGYTAHGTENAALAAGGLRYKSHIYQYLMINTEEWNGSAWSATTNLPHQLAFLNHQKGGTQNASLIAGGYTGTGGNNVGSGSEAFQRTNVTWDGLSYTIGACMANERSAGGFVGSINTGLAQGSAAGCTQGTTCTEEWNGIAWSDAAASNFPTAHNQTVGTTNDAMHTTDFQNAPNKTACTDFYNGLSWNIGPTAPSGGTLELKCAGSAGSTSAGLFMAGNSSCIQHFNVFNTTASLGTIETPNLSIDGGTSLEVKESFQLPIFSGSIFPVTSSAGEVWYNCTEEKLYFTYDINSWSEVADTNSSHAVGGYGGGIGDGIVWAGGGPGPAYTSNSEVWNGTSWSEVNNLNTAGVYVPGAGSSNAAIAAGRNTPGFQSCTELWDGTSWTEANDGAIGYGASFAGTVNAGFQAGCRNPGNSQPDDATKEWNGTNWYAGGDQISAKADQAAMLGTQNAAKHMGGGGGAYDAPLYLTDLVEDYNGTSFSTATSLPVGTHYSSGGGTQNAGIMAGGLSANSPHTTATYEWNGVSFHQTANLANGRRTNDIADGSQSSFQVSGGGPFANTTCVKTEQYTTTGIGCHCIGGV